MNILIGKIGQKIIFNRDSSECDRSNTNGNVGTYLLTKLLIENNPEHTFYIASENDLDSFSDAPFENVVDASKVSWEVLEVLGMDAMFAFTGMTQFERNEEFIKMLNYLTSKYILLSDDPRCLDSVENDYRFARQPDVIISQFVGTYMFKGQEHNVVYEPIERASCYKCKYEDEAKETDMLIISNTSGKEYNRVKIISEIITECNGIDIYGRLSEEEKNLLGESKCKGEIKYSELQKVFKKAYSTFIVPIKKGWVTSKYVECLMNGVFPIFHEDYNTNLLECNDFAVISSKEEFAEVFETLKNNKETLKPLVDIWRERIIEPYISGKKLSNTLISYITK